MKSKHIVIYSHGFGVQKDDDGLFTDISKALKEDGIQSVLFDYFEYHSDTKELLTTPFSDQVKKLAEVIKMTREENPDARISIIGHSQGCIIPTLCNLEGVERIIAISPFFHTDMSEVLKRYTKNANNHIELTGISRRYRSNGSVTVIPPEYWQERFATDVIALYNRMALEIEFTTIYGLNDEIMSFSDFNKLKYVRMINTDGDHNFSKSHRSDLIALIRKELL